MNRRSIILLSVAGALLTAGAVVAIAASLRPADEPAPGGTSVHQVTESPHDVETYWTPERMRTAEGG